MSARGAALAGVVLLWAGCVYYNALYNAEHVFAQGEAERAAGRDSLARARYLEVVEKAAKGYRMEPTGEWADDALLLLGRAYLRIGDLRAARATLERAEQITDDDQVRLSARVYLGAAYVEAGELEAAIPLLNEALRGLRPGPIRAEGHLWRARALLAHDEPDAGWWDLDQAAAGPAGVRVAAALDGVAWGVRTNRPERAKASMDRLLAESSAGQSPDTVVALLGMAAEQVGPIAAVSLLGAVDTTRWGPVARGRIRLVQADLLRLAGDTLGARRVVSRVADGFGDAAVRARTELARWRLAGAQDLVDARDAGTVLLPAAADSEAAKLLASLGEMNALAAAGLENPLGLFGAAEVARDQLGAPGLARGLFLAYADQDPDAPWSAKALLAALALTEDEGGRAWLRGRLEGRADSPYVLAARGEPAPELEPLEEELGRRLQEIKAR